MDEPTRIEVFFPDKNTTGNYTPSLIILNGHMLRAFIHALARGIPEFENNPFRMQMRQGDAVIGSGRCKVMNGNFTILQQDDGIKETFSSFSEIINDPDFTWFEAKRRLDDRLKGLANFTDSATRETIDVLVTTMLNDEELANKIIHTYLSKIQKHYQPEWK